MALSIEELDAYIQNSKDEASTAQQAAAESMDMSKSVLSPDYRARSSFGGQEIGGLVGSVGGAVIGSLGGPTGANIGSTVGAGVGGALGEAATQVLSDEPLSGKRIASAGVEEAAWDAGGNLVMKVAGKLVKLGANALGFGKEQIPDATKAADEFLRTHGSALPEAAKTGSTLDTMLEGVTYTPATVDIFLNKQKEIQTALTTGSKEILNSLAKTPEFDYALKSATSPQRASGEVLQNFVKGGMDALSANVKPVYKEIFGDTASTVSTFDLKSWAGKQLTQPASLTAGQKTILKEVQGLPPNLQFEYLHDIRSRWLAENRDKFASVSSSEKDTLASKTISDLVKRIDNSMDMAAGKTLDKETYGKYRTVTDTYRTGIQGLQSNAINEAMTQAPEQVGAFLFKSGNETPIQDLFKSVSAASTLSKKPSNEIIDSLRYGYLEAMVNTPENMLKFANNMKQDTGFRNTYNMLFRGTPQDQAIQAMSEAASKGLVGAAHLPGLNMRTVGSALNIGGGVAAVGTGYYFLLSQDQQERVMDNLGSAAVSGGALMLSQRQLAKLMLNPAGAQAITKLSTARDKIFSPSAFTKTVIEPLANVFGPEDNNAKTRGGPSGLSNTALENYINTAK